MECKKYVKNGLLNTERFVGSCRVGLKFRSIGSRALRLDVATGVPSATAVGTCELPVAPLHPLDHRHDSDHPFMNTMDEISYWIYTKRAPCLMNYDNEIKKQSEELQCSQTKQKSIIEVPSPKKKKKRKLSMFDDKSTSTEKQQNVYFNSSQNKKQNVKGSCKSEALGSDIDFNIKISSVQGKGKRLKLQKNSRTTVHKKNKLVTSTPKVSQLRRSLRQAQQNNNSQLNSSFEVFNASIINGHSPKNGVLHLKSPEKTKNSTELLAAGDQSPDDKKNIGVPTINKSKNEVLNGQFDDLSDVSGFTANYIRSTKLQSTRTPRKLRCKNSRDLVKGSRRNVQKDSNMVVCVNKSVSTAHKSAVQNYSTDSDNVINLVTTRSNEKAAKVSKSTSLLKFLDSTTDKDPSNGKIVSAKTRKAAVNDSFQSKSSTSRYPKRTRNCLKTQDVVEESQNNTILEENKKNSKNISVFNNSDRKENPDATVVSKTRSGRNIGLTLRQPDNSVLVLSNSTEQVSSMVSMNVATPIEESKERKKKRVTRHLRSMKVQPVSFQRDSLRDKSGFTACFSDSDDNSEHLKQRKFFCA